MGAFDGQDGVIAVAGVDPGGVGQSVENTGLQVVHEGGEIVRVGGFSRPAGKQRVAGPQVVAVSAAWPGGVGRVGVEQSDAAGRVAAQSDHR